MLPLLCFRFSVVLVRVNHDDAESARDVSVFGTGPGDAPCVNT